MVSGASSRYGDDELATLPPELSARLDAAGAQLDARQWSRLPLAARRRLLAMPIAGALERQTFVALVRWLRETFDPDHE